MRVILSFATILLQRNAICVAVVTMLCASSSLSHAQDGLNSGNNIGGRLTAPKYTSRDSQLLSNTNRTSPYRSPGTKSPANELDQYRQRAFQQLDVQVTRMDSQFGLLRRIYQLVVPTVVHIESTKQPENGGGISNFPQKPIEEAGAGILLKIDGDDYVVTNRHVVYPAKMSEIKIEFSNRQIVRPKRIWADATTDIAVLAIPTHNGPTARIGDSNSVEIGDYVLAIGSPFGLSRSLTQGILSAKGRRNLELGSRPIEIQDFFQTDAAINPGNSGGPLINLRGEVIGINTAIASNSGGSEGIGFAIPINLVTAVAERLVKQGTINRAYLGVQMDNDFSVAKANRLGLKSPIGALVKAVRPHSPAEEAGIKVGDVILQLDATRIENDGHLVQTVGLKTTQRPVIAFVWRAGQKIQIDINLVEMPSY